MSFDNVLPDDALIFFKRSTGNFFRVLANQRGLVWPWPDFSLKTLLKGFEVYELDMIELH